MVEKYYPGSILKSPATRWSKSALQSHWIVLSLAKPLPSLSLQPRPQWKACLWKSKICQSKQPIALPILWDARPQPLCQVSYPSQQRTGIWETGLSLPIKLWLFQGTYHTRMLGLEGDKLAQGSHVRRLVWWHRRWRVQNVMITGDEGRERLVGDRELLHGTGLDQLQRERKKTGLMKRIQHCTLGIGTPHRMGSRCQKKTPLATHYPC